MKKILFPLVVVLFINYDSIAQQKDTVVTLPEIKVTSSSKVSKQVEKAFQKAFPDAVWVRWFKLNQNYLTKFIKEDMDHNALFSKNGYLKYDISYGFESNLPSQFRDEAKSTYPDFKIIRVANVKEAQRDIWVINLESLNHYVIARVENGEMEEVERLDKSE